MFDWIPTYRHRETVMTEVLGITDYEQAVVE